MIPPARPSSPPSDSDNARSRPPETRTTPSHRERDASPDDALRRRLGAHLAALSDTINSNLAVFRYGAVGSILLLGAYGIANTPLFYRYRSVWDVPAKMWRRRWIHGTIVGMHEGPRQKAASRRASSETHRPIVLLFRHSSPIERLLPRNAPARILRSSVATRPQTRHSIPIELAGIFRPPPALGGISHEETNLIHPLVQNKTPVSIQLLAQRVDVSCEADGARPPISDDVDILQSTAICHLVYRKSKRRWFQTADLSVELLASGQAVLSSCVVPRSSDQTDDETRIIHFDPTPEHLQSDAAFMSLLEQAEYSAWKKKLGVWSSEEMRESRTEYKQEEDFIRNRWSTRISNALRRGWGWIRK